MNTASIVQKIRSYCNVLRDVGVSYGDYLEQLTYLLFLKMADEYGKPPYNRDIGIPDEFAWPELKKRQGAELETFYVKLLREFSRQKGMLGQIFTNQRRGQGRKRSRSVLRTCRNLSNYTIRQTGMSARKPGTRKRIPKAAGASSVTKK